jgi:hypothetical protein
VCLNIASSRYCDRSWCRRAATSHALNGMKFRTFDVAELLVSYAISVNVDRGQLSALARVTQTSYSGTGTIVMGDAATTASLQWLHVNMVLSRGVPLSKEQREQLEQAVGDDAVCSCFCARVVVFVRACVCCRLSLFPCHRSLFAFRFSLLASRLSLFACRFSLCRWSLVVGRLSLSLCVGVRGEWCALSPTLPCCAWCASHDRRWRTRR